MQEGPDRVDYQETRDVTEVHASIQREHSDPRADVTPIPVWLTVVCGIAVCWAGAYLGTFHGGFRADVYNEYDSSPELIFPIKQRGGAGPDGEKEPEASLAQQGKSVYASQCTACHSANGQGIPGVNPPLVESEWVIGGEKRLIAILLKGLQGPLKVKGATYNGNMPPWEGALTDKKIAAVASYIRSEWGNSAGEINEAKVKAARAEFASHAGQMTEADLLAIPADAALPDAGGAAPQGGDATAAGAASAAAGAPAAAASSAGATAPAAPAAGPATEQLMAEGKKHYLAICVACHQPTGMGLPPAFPPLVGTDYVTGDPKRFAAIVLKGVAGPITVGSVTYNSVMPGQEMMLSDAKIAAILTYVRGSFGNSAPPVNPDVVAAARKEFAGRATPWTEAELKAMAEGGAAASAPAGALPAQAESVPAGTTPPAEAPAPAASAETSAHPAAPAAREEAAPPSASTPESTPAKPATPASAAENSSSAALPAPSAAAEAPAPPTPQDAPAASPANAAPVPAGEAAPAPAEAPATAQ
jgi:mono/diheme cytochrome c family protein